MTDYRMDEAHPGLALDRGVQNILGKPLDRIDGPVKVTGGATYALEHQVDRMAWGVAITAPIGRGRITAIDTKAAEGLPGVIAIYAGDDALPRQTPVFGQDQAQRYDGTIDSWGEVIGLAVAESLEQARAAARAVVVSSSPEQGVFLTKDGEPDAFDPPSGALLPNIVKGDLDQAMRDAAVAIDVDYSTPRQVHAAMEPHGAIAEWHDDKLTMRCSMQIFRQARPVLAKSLGISPDDIRLISPFIGGGFGGKNVSADAILAAVAAKRLGRPVKVALARQQIFHACYGRSDTYQRIRLAADADGRLLGYGQDSLVSQKVGATSFEPVPLGAVALYDGEHRSFTTRIAPVNLVAHGPVRAPGEAVGMIALECAMDELARELGLDPIELRRRNEPENDPTSGKPFSSRRLIDCFDEGARRFGWGKRERRSEGEWLVGHGVATAARVNFLADSSARVTLTPEGRAVIETDMTDLGTGTYTILAQVAGEALGLPMDHIDVRLGDSEFPVAAGSGGSFGAASASSSVALACEEIAEKLAKAMGAKSEDVTLKDGHAIAGNRRVPHAELVGDTPIAAIGTIHPGANNRRFSQATHGAQFCEAWVNAVTGEVRVKRMLGVFDCGRILNHKTARSQGIGGMIWGLGYALHEEVHIDPRTGAIVNRDFGEYHIPANADVPQIECYFVEEIDRHANPLGAKGIGELGISGAGAAVANAVFDACGVRVRDFPITPDKLLLGLPPI
ncbi:xanthine dehydrogenase family protein molybdopterin-binding subunit [Sphingomonas sp. TX0543]|uniref:xanthine dehydrogenase family protein molybdopterin-binding subunit n=1 Tax=unclassified Sphingomonas TaxID=196159 RepID=UPI0010F6B911|nr:xanthine dehydrogenase family protein molybdopterin-binding subunit [Sphingomonas sp. 3P27F8]